MTSLSTAASKVQRIRIGHGEALGSVAGARKRQLQQSTEYSGGAVESGHRSCIVELGRV